MQHFRQCRHDVAVVGHSAARADAALKHQAVLQPGIDAEVHGVEVLGLLAVVLGERHEVSLGQRERRRLQVEGRQLYPPPFGSRGSLGTLIVNRS